MHSALLLSALVVAQADASRENVDARWLPWLGCWTLIGDDVRLPVLGGTPEIREERRAPRGLVCLAPSTETGGVRVTTLAGGETLLEEALLADGAARPVIQGDCRGWERADWSRDGHRLFTHSELTCDEDGERVVSGISLMVGWSTWVEIQSVTSDDARAVLVRRYRPADAREVSEAGYPALAESMLHDASRARMQTPAAMDVGDVIEATSRVDPEAVEAALLESDRGFALDSDALVRLDEAGVAPGVIDLMVALSYPDRFVVDREPGQAAAAGASSYPSIYDPFFPHAFAYPYYFAPFGYYYGYAPYNRIFVRPVVTPGISAGRVVKDRGYTRVSPRESAGGGLARRRGESGDGGDNGHAVGGSSSSQSPHGSVSGQGYTRSGSSGRRAKPKRND